MGDEAVTLRIADKSVRLSCDAHDPLWGEALRHIFRGFIVQDGEADLLVNVHVAQGSKGDFPSPLERPAWKPLGVSRSRSPERPFEVRMSKEGLVFVFSGGVAEYRRNPLSVRIHLSGGGSSIRAAADLPLPLFFLSSMALPRRSTFLVHGAGVMRGGIGYLFLGPSGAGKSTAAGFFGPDQLISDDGVAVVRRDRRFIMYPMPFLQLHSGEGIEDGFSGVNSRVDKIFFLVKDSRNYIERAGFGESLLRLMKGSLFFSEFFGREDSIRAFDFFYDLCREVSCCHLHFKRDGSFLEMLT